MRNFRTLALGAATLALIVSACAPGGGTTAQPTAAPKPTQAPATVAASPAAKPAASPVVSPAASPAAVASPSPASKPAASPVAKPAASPSPSPVAKPADGPRPTVRVGSANFPESVLLAEIYGQALEANGYPVERNLNLGNREIIQPALQNGQIDLIPEYLASFLAFASDDVEATTDADETRQRLNQVLQSRGLEVLEPAPAVNTNGFVVTQATAQRHNLRKLSDLQPVASQLVLGGPPECPERAFCLLGLQDTYGLEFREFLPLDVGGPLTVAALENEQIDVGVLFTTDPAITQRNFVLLEDDRNLQLADNVAPVVRQELLNQAPPDLRSTLNAVSAKLTTETLIRLNGQVAAERRDPRDVAAEWLQQNGPFR